jgi:DNA-binding Lrp family transcriptional regulator
VPGGQRVDRCQRQPVGAGQLCRPVPGERRQQRALDHPGQLRHPRLDHVHPGRQHRHLRLPQRRRLDRRQRLQPRQRPGAPGLSIGTFTRIRPNPGQLPGIAGLARQIPEVVECHRFTGDDCFILKVRIPAMDQLERLLDRCLLFSSTTKSIIQSSPVPPRSLPLRAG